MPPRIDTSELADRLAALLGRAADAWQAEIASRRESLEARRAALATAVGPPVNPDELRPQARRLEAEIAQYRSELARSERTRDELREEERRLTEHLHRAHERLRSRCADLVSFLPLLSQSGGSGWVSWLEDWHQRLCRSFEPPADWRQYLELRHVVDDALTEVEPILRYIHELEVASGEAGVARAALPAEIAREEEQIRQLEASFTSRARQGGARYGRILEDLPEVPAHSSLLQLEQLRGLLVHLEATLQRFAQSALLESQMLEALQ